MSDGVTAEGAILEVNTAETIDSPTWTRVLERTQINITRNGETIDMTNFDSEGFREFLPGLRNSSMTANGNFVPTDDGYEELRDAHDDGVPIPGIRVLWRDAPGSSTYFGTVWDSGIVTNLGEDGSVGDKINLNLSLQLSGKPDYLSDVTPGS